MKKVIDGTSTYYLLDNGDKLVFMSATRDGTTNEEVIEVLMDRIKELDSKVPSVHNYMALSYLELALNHLKRRHEEQEQKKNATQSNSDTN